MKKRTNTVFPDRRGPRKSLDKVTDKKTSQVTKSLLKVTATFSKRHTSHELTFVSEKLEKAGTKKGPRADGWDKVQGSVDQRFAAISGVVADVEGKAHVESQVLDVQDVKVDL